MSEEKNFIIIGKAEIQVCLTAKNEKEAKEQFNKMNSSDVLETMKDSACAFCVDFDDYSLEEI